MQASRHSRARGAPCIRKGWKGLRLPCFGAGHRSGATRKHYDTASASGLLDLQVTVTHYPVAGASYDALTRSLSANGPKGFHGLASWRTGYKFTTTRQADRCRIDTVTTHVRELALLVKERLLGIGSVPCDEVQALAQAEFERLYRHLKTRDRQYDARTGDGATQGAWFTPGDQER